MSAVSYVIVVVCGSHVVEMPPVLTFLNVRMTIFIIYVSIIMCMNYALQGVYSSLKSWNSNAILNSS